MGTLALLRRLLVLLALHLAFARGAAAQEKFALLIGNQGHKETVGPLRNPHNDVSVVAAALDKLGFKITVVKDAGYKTIDTALKTHIQQVRRAGKDTMSFFYYSGHGASDPETRINDLIPTDVDSADDANLWTNSFELNDIVSKLREQAPEATHYVVFDACRDELRLTRQGKKALGAEKGFTPVSTVTGVMIAYAPLQAKPHPTSARKQDPTPPQSPRRCQGPASRPLPCSAMSSSKCSKRSDRIPDSPSQPSPPSTSPASRRPKRSRLCSGARSRTARRRLSSRPT
jgi:Caspase domain